MPMGDEGPLRGNVLAMLQHCSRMPLYHLNPCRVEQVEHIERIVQDQQHTPHPPIEHMSLTTTQRDLVHYPSLNLSLYPLLQAPVGI
jgi:hypothetical protein